MSKIKIIFSIIIILTFGFYFYTNAKYFSDFDEVNYYRIANEEILNQSQKDSILQKITNLDYPDKINDEVFLNYLNSKKYFKTNLENEDLMILKNEILVNNFSFTRQSNACIPTYRDILILKKNKKIIGIAKICFECKMFYFFGNNKNIDTESFNSTKEFEDLEKLLSKYKNSNHK
jgi:hypothetical protein